MSLCKSIPFSLILGTPIYQFLFSLLSSQNIIIERTALQCFLQFLEGSSEDADSLLNDDFFHVLVQIFERILTAHEISIDTSTMTATIEFGDDESTLMNILQILNLTCYLPTASHLLQVFLPMMPRCILSTADIIVHRTLKYISDVLRNNKDIIENLLNPVRIPFYYHENQLIECPLTHVMIKLFEFNFEFMMEDLELNLVVDHLYFRRCKMQFQRYYSNFLTDVSLLQGFQQPRASPNENNELKRRRADFELHARICSQFLTLLNYYASSENHEVFTQLEFPYLLPLLGNVILAMTGMLDTNFGGDLLAKAPYCDLWKKARLANWDSTYRSLQEVMRKVDPNFDVDEAEHTDDLGVKRHAIEFLSKIVGDAVGIISNVAADEADYELLVLNNTIPSDSPINEPFFKAIQGVYTHFPQKCKSECLALVRHLAAGTGLARNAVIANNMLPFFITNTWHSMYSPAHPTSIDKQILDVWIALLDDRNDGNEGDPEQYREHTKLLLTQLLAMQNVLPVLKAMEMLHENYKACRTRAVKIGEKMTQVQMEMNFLDRLEEVTFGSLDSNFDFDDDNADWTSAINAAHLLQ
ncbi:hypothetical protein BLNAU_19817 [Blattamonas nauphoetae]|uniref:Uncharacterized protein n=1 Tax=Blattamonas nauphoetae TaxID=2049346 RepID=A0ABQ9X0C0_9EUKA|nr:hypothetical protein BLNAU_19817 [Blattamonas nauphoetae]